MVAILITAGLSIDYTVHIIFHYMINEYTDNVQRINASLEACALSMLQVINYSDNFIQNFFLLINEYRIELHV